MNTELKKKLLTEEWHTFESLKLLVSVLRGEGGCMWDREQTHATIRNDIIEETYEVVEAIDKNDLTLLREELGDVLFQVMFHSQIEREAGTFTVDDVIHDVCHKMISRHPHVFGDVDVENSGQILANWEVIKNAEKSRETPKDTLLSVPKQYPALMRARKIVKKSKKFGYSFPTDEEAQARIKELLPLLSLEDESARQRAASEIMFLTTVMARGADVEKGVSDYVDGFIESFPEVEK